MQSAKAVCDSIGIKSPRLHTQLWRYPSMVHQESLRHRKLYIHDQLAMHDFDFSFSVSSTRAVPFKKNLEEVRSPELRAKPAKWGTEQKGMIPGDELSDELGEDPFVGPDGTLLSPRGMAELIWDRASQSAAKYAEQMAELGVHKSICNRIIAPSLHTNCLTTGTHDGWMNFFGLRLDSAADHTLRALAEESWIAWNESVPNHLVLGDWHLPYADDEETILSVINSYAPGSKFDEINDLIKVSVARCARLSYISFETGKKSTIVEDLKLYDRLVGSAPIHASPAEHQACLDTWRSYGKAKDHSTGVEYDVADWENKIQAGNLGPGWRQYRKMLPNEAVAPLPEQYL